MNNKVCEALIKPVCGGALKPYTKACAGSNELPEAIPTAIPQTLPMNTIPGVSPEQLKAMQAYAIKLKRNSPKMKLARLQRKVAEHFKVKLV